MNKVNKKKHQIKKASPKVLTAEEAKELASLEKTIQSGQPKFIEVGNALLTIREKKLYRASHRSFAGYCADRFEFSRAHGNRLAKAAETRGSVNQKLGELGLNPIQSENAVRELGRLKEKEMGDVINNMADDIQDAQEEKKGFPLKKLKEEVKKIRPVRSNKAAKPKASRNDDLSFEQVIEPIFNGSLLKSIPGLRKAVKDHSVVDIEKWMNTYASGFVQISQKSNIKDLFESYKSKVESDKEPAEKTAGRKAATASSKAKEKEAA